MRKVFICSLCNNGILGGGLYLDNNSVTYKTQKLKEIWRSQNNK